MKLGKIAGRSCGTTSDAPASDAEAAPASDAEAAVAAVDAEAAVAAVAAVVAAASGTEAALDAAAAAAAPATGAEAALDAAFASGTEAFPFALDFEPLVGADFARSCCSCCRYFFALSFWASNACANSVGGFCCGSF